MNKDLIDRAFQEYVAFGFRRGLYDCFDASFAHDEEDVGYSYLHWKAENVAVYPDSPLSTLWSEAYRAALLKLDKLGLDFSSVKVGEIVLRILSYDDRRAAKKHYDIDLYTYNIGSIDDRHEFHPTDSIHYGTFAERLGLCAATPHKFNPRGHAYSMVLFVVPHFSIELPTGETVGQILQQCYNKTPNNRWKEGQVWKWKPGSGFGLQEFKIVNSQINSEGNLYIGTWDGHLFGTILEEELINECELVR